MNTASIVNMVQQDSKQPKPEVGMGATMLCWTDRHACTVVEVKSPCCIVVQQDDATRTDKNGMSDCQTFEYKCNPDGRLMTVTLRRNGRWVRQGDTMKGGTSFGLGYRDEHFDFSF